MATQAFHVPLSLYLSASFVARTRGLWKWLGNVESWALREQCAGVAIDRPIYVAGLARSGSTVLLEILAAHPPCAAHAYRNFPFVFTPYWWEYFLSRTPRQPTAPVERAHADGLLVSSESPEAMEEMLWMAFFPHLHDAARSGVLDRDTECAAFEAFYRDHIRKLLLAHQAQRYVAKGNYNVTRLEYLHKLFPDARFVLPVRHPRTQIASLCKQHELFTAAARTEPRSTAILDTTGHFEFGVHRTPINCGDTAATRSVAELWAAGDEVRGWARYWAQIYGHLADRLDSSAALRQATRIVRYEDLCGQPADELTRLLAHCQLDRDETLFEQYRNSLHPPTYYQADFTTAEEQAIAEETAAVARRFDYDSERPAR